MLLGDNYKVSGWHDKKWQLSRFIVAEKLLDFSNITSWIDIGCGTGDFFNFILNKYEIEDVIGIDTNKKSIDISKKLNERFDIKYIIDDFLNIVPSEKYDLVTFSGVLQLFPHNKLSLIINKLKEYSNNLIWIDTLNYSNGLSVRDGEGYYRYEINYLKNNINDVYKIGTFNIDNAIDYKQYQDEMIYVIIGKNKK